MSAAWSSARAGKGSIVHLDGPPGAGKSSLLTRFLDQARRPDDRALVVLARCSDAPEGQRHGVVEELILRVAEGVRAVDEGEDDGALPWLLPGGAFLAAAADLALLPDAGEARPERARVFADVLLDVARAHPVLVALDDARRADRASRAVVEALAEGLKTPGNHRLLVLLASSSPLADPEAPPDPGWYPDPTAVLPLEPLGEDVLRAQAATRLARYGKPKPSYLQALLDASRGNPQVLDGLIGLSERAGAFEQGAVDDPGLTARPGFPVLAALARGALVPLPPAVRADLQAAAVAGPRFDAAILGEVWGVDAAAAQARIVALQATGLVGPDGDGASFVAAGVAAHFAASLPDERRHELLARVAGVLCRTADARLKAVDASDLFDVTQTWSDGRSTVGGLNEALDLLQVAARHFAAAGRLVEAAEAAVALVEGFFGRATLPQLSGRHIRKSDRERRRQLSAALAEAAAWLERAREPLRGAVDEALLAVDVRRLAAEARFRASVGDFASARQDAVAAVTLAGHLPALDRRLDAGRTLVEVCYGAGDGAAGRRAMVELIRQADAAPDEQAVAVYEWLAELTARWEWVGLHDRLFAFFVARLEARGATKAAVKARVERLATALVAEDGPHLDALGEEVEAAAREAGHLAALAEMLARAGADVIRGLVERHFDGLSGEFFPPDLEGEDAGAEPLRRQLARSTGMLATADALAEASGEPLARLRVLHGTLQVLFEGRERLLELMERWAPAHGETRPPRLAEVAELVEQGFFSVTHAEDQSERILALASELGLHQLLADTAYEALERGLPAAAREPERYVELARASYEEVDDVYGLITLAMVMMRMAERTGADAEAPARAAERLLAERGAALLPDQRAFVHMQLAERLLMTGGDAAVAAEHLERAIGGYDEVGEVDQVQLASEMLREVYGKLGDLGRYRALRARFRAVEERRLGVDPLGLEMRIEHLLNLAGHEADDVKAIEMVERCVALFARLPDGTMRIDECFVEISKICRRRADEAQTEGGFEDWLHRSLEAVRAAAGINRSLGNHHRVFEEYHELFDDLLGMGATEEYLRARAESRELAFEAGNLDELIYLFEEHLQLEPGEPVDPAALAEARAYFEALLRYLRGLGADRHARRLRERFVSFLGEIGELDLARAYGLTDLPS
ncbi:MAG: ATP-binding protein [Myxococcales bacterium]|nr:ATP-binding protein [Myxococcales bacterium]